MKNCLIKSLFAILCLFSSLAQASLDGTFSGAVTGQMVCSTAELPTTFTYSGTLSIQAAANVVTLSISSSTLNFSGSGSAAESTPGNFSITTSGTLNINAGDGELDGSYTPATFNPQVQLSGNQLIVQATVGTSTAGTPCGLVFFDINLATLTGGNSLVFNPEQTPGSIITAPLILNSQVTPIITDISVRTNDTLRGSGNGFRNNGLGLMYGLSSGINAGDNAPGYGAWVSYSYTDFENDFAATAFDGARHGVLVGVDFSPWEKVLVGMLVGYESNDIDTSFNRGQMDADGYTVATYFGALLSDTFSVDASVGYSSVDTDQFRTSGVATRVTSSTDTDRYFGAFNLNGVWYQDSWVLGARTGFLFVRSDQDAFIESDGTNVGASSTKLNQWNVGADAAYSMGAWEPFSRLTYENDFSQTEIAIAGAVQPSSDHDSLVLGFGLRYFSDTGFTANLEMSKRLGKTDFDEHTINFTLRGEF